MNATKVVNVSERCGKNQITRDLGDTRCPERLLWAEGGGWRSRKSLERVLEPTSLVLSEK